MFSTTSTSSTLSSDSSGDAPAVKPMRETTFSGKPVDENFTRNSFLKDMTKSVLQLNHCQHLIHEEDPNEFSIRMICSNEIVLDPLLTYFANNSICSYLHLPRTLANHTQILFCVMSLEEANDFRVLGKFPTRDWHGHTINLHYRVRYAIQYYAHCYGG